MEGRKDIKEKIHRGKRKFKKLRKKHKEKRKEEKEEKLRKLKREAEVWKYINKREKKQ